MSRPRGATILSPRPPRAIARRLPRYPTRHARLNCAQRAELVTLKARLERVPTRGLNEDDALNRAYLLRVIDQTIEGIDLDFGRAPISNGDGYFTFGDYLAYTTPIQSGDDAEAWIARLEALPNFYQQNLTNARRGIETGVHAAAHRC